LHNNTNGGRNLGSQGSVQYGLIAEEVDKVYPELVIRDDTGKIQGVHYEELAPMLLSEMQQQQRINAVQAAKNAEQSATITAQAAEISALERQIAELGGLKQELHAALRRMQLPDKLVAQR